MSRLVTILLFVLPLMAGATLMRPGYEGVRPTGMGDAFTALADDQNALFYNPAGLARIKGVHFNLFDITVGADSDRTLTRFNDAVFKGDFDHLLSRDKQYLKLGFKPTFIVPGFGFSVFQDASGFFDMANPTVDGIDVYGRNDLGLVMGAAIPMGDYFSVGFSGKVFQRTGIDMTLSPQDLISDPAFLASIVNGTAYNVLEDSARSGWATALNAGVLARIPLQDKGKNANRLTASAVIDNIGTTTFKGLGNDRTPASIAQSLTVGLGYQSTLDKNWIWNLVADMRDLLVSQPFIKQFHVGTEFRHKVFGLRAGISNGYPTAGFSIEFPPHTRIHFSTHSKELGNAFQQRENRWYLLQLVIGFNPI